MNLIECFGYEKVEDALNQLNLEKKDLLTIGASVFTKFEVEEILLEHRRANNIFEVGDFVVLKDGNCTLMYSLYERIGDYVYLKRPSGREFDFRLQDIRHATTQEIEAGHRL